MPTTIDCRFDVFVAGGHDANGSAYGEMYALWLDSELVALGETPTGVIPDDQLLLVRTLTGHTGGDWSTLWYAYLSFIAPPTIGQTRPDLDHWFWCTNAGIITAPAEGGFSSGFDGGFD